MKQCCYIDYKQLEPAQRYCKEDSVLGTQNCYLHCSDAERNRVFTLDEFDRIFDNNWPTQGQAYNRLRASIARLDMLSRSQ